MKYTKIFSLLYIIMFIGLIGFNTWVGAEIYEHTNPNIQIKSDIMEVLEAPDSMNISDEFLNTLVYSSNVQADRRIKWKITTYEKTDNFHIAEGDKNLKKGDTIICTIGSNPELQLPEVDTWCLIYVNDVMARYDPVDNHVSAVFKYIQPISINSSGSYMDYGDYLTTTLDDWVNKDAWNVEDKVIKYNYTLDEGISDTDGINTTTIESEYSRSNGLLNEMYYQVSYVNGSGFHAGVNLTFTRLHGWGLPYNISTWLIWTPIILIIIALIVAIRFRLFQRLKLYLEARKLARRD